MFLDQAKKTPHYVVRWISHTTLVSWIEQRLVNKGEANNAHDAGQQESSGEIQRDW